MSAPENDERPLWARGIEGYVALVTGSGRGLGRACALALSGAGARVIAVSRTGKDLADLAGQAPGPVETWAEDATGLAAAVLYLASPASGIVTGTSLRVDGGWTAH